MKITLVSLAMVLAVSSCSKKPVETTNDTSDAQKANELAAELRSMEQQEEKLRREIELERLAMEREELRLQRDALADQGKRLSAEELALERERTALAEQRAADAEADARAAATPPPPQPSQTNVQQPYRPAPVTVSQTPVSALGDYDYSVFYDRLSGHGSWLQSPDYGYVWRPSVYASNRDWRPYTNGSWAHTDYGWTWVSNEPFGWATYHYGRWVLLRNTGWCWIPGNEWAPAWVCWKSGGDYVGWAPLPPESLYWRGNDWSTYYGNSSGISPSCFSFVRVSSFGSAIINAVFSRNDCVRIYQQTNYVGGYRWNNRRVYCDGISYDYASRHADRPLTRYQCDFDNRLPNSRDPLHYASRRGDRLSIHAPNFNVPWNGALRPRSYDNKPLQDEVIRERSFEPKLRDRFISERNKDREHAEESMRGGLAKKMTERIALEEKISRQREELATTLETVNPDLRDQERDKGHDRDKDKDKEKDERPHDSNRGPGGRDERPGQPGVVIDPSKEPRPDQKPSDNRGDGRPQRPERPSDVVAGQGTEQNPVADVPPPVTDMPKRDVDNHTDKRDREESTDRSDRIRQMEEVRQRQEQEKQQRALREDQEKAARAQEQAQQTSQQNGMREQQREREAQENRREAEEKAASEAAKEAEKVAKQQNEREEKGRESQQRMQQEQQREQQNQLKKQQQEQEEIREEQAKAQRMQAEMQQRREQEAAREAQDKQKQDQMRQQQDAARAAQEQARQEQMRESQEQSRRAQMQQQQEAVRAAQEQARQEQMREAQEQSRRAQMQQQQEAARAAQEQARQEQMREAQEQSRRAQMQQQQEAARAAQDQARQQQMREAQEQARQEHMREAQEQSRREQMRQQQDAAREAQEQSRRQEESNRRQQQENQDRSSRDRR